MEEEERERYLKKYGVDAEKLREIMNNFTNRAATEVVGPNSKAWLMLLEALTYMEAPSQTLLDMLAKFLPKPSPRTLATWRTLRIGSDPRITTDFASAIQRAGMHSSDESMIMFRHPSLREVEREMDITLVKISVAELGFPQWATRASIYSRALELGLALCPAEVGPRLRIQYRDQPRHAALFVAMEPIPGPNDAPSIFELVSGNGLWLYGNDGSADRQWGSGMEWVFASHPFVFSNC